MALMILVYVVDHTLPENYFSHTLYALSGDMAVFRHLLKFYLPELALHMETLQKEASGTIRKSYSSENPPDRQSVHAYEPPLADVFSMQWFLTIFASVLPRKACRRVWDAIFLEGSEYVLYTAVAILAVMERDLLLTSTAADFYMAMSKLSEQLRKAHIMSSAEFLQVVYAIKRTTSFDSDEPVPVVSDLREKFTYNIYPCGLQPELGGARKEPRPMAPLPSRGGSFTAESSCDESRKRSMKLPERRKNGHDKKMWDVRETPSKASLQKTLCVGGEGDDYSTAMSGPLHQQLRHLGKHYSSIAQQPTHIHCDMHLTPPIARAFCPQQQKDRSPVPYYTAYAADVPLKVIQQSRVLSGFDQMVKLHEQRKEQFMISFTEPYLQTGETGEGGGSGTNAALTRSCSNQSNVHKIIFRFHVFQHEFYLIFTLPLHRRCLIFSCSK
ncbi:TBC1 domain family member 30 [Geodia barretti]|nr:TBC1 domain family member 30 [Geodia barretti]